jgi:hypothetical protein
MGDFGYGYGEERIEVAEGFETDFASVPSLLWWILPQWGTYGNAAVVHDWLYWKQDRSRTEADGIFLEGMSLLGVSAWKKYLMYVAVRAFGWLGWWRNQWDRAAGFNRVRQQKVVEAGESSRRPGVSRRVWQHYRQRGMGQDTPSSSLKSSGETKGMET